MTRIHILRTGSVWIKAAQVRGRGTGLRRLLTGFFDPVWSAELPIYAYLIERNDGLILVDTGETAKASKPGYYDSWHPAFRYATRFAVRPEDEIGPQLIAAGFDPRDVGTVVLTHLHGDHSGGLPYFPHARIIVSEPEWRAAQGVMGRLNGYPNNRWPRWLKPDVWRLPTLEGDLLAASVPLTRDGAVRLVATPGHSAGHLSVLVEADGVAYLIAGDVSYQTEALIDRVADGVGVDPKAQIATHEAVLTLARKRPLVYLNAHDPASAERLVTRAPL